MTAYLGPSGNLVKFEGMSDEQIGTGDRVTSLKLTFAGVQKAKVSPRSPRAWQVGIGTATPDQVAQLQGLLLGLYGPPPWTYVGSWAQVTNLLTPAVSLCETDTLRAGGQGGRVTLDSGATPMQSMLIRESSGQTASFPAVSCIPGVPVTASVWAAGTSGYSVELQFLDRANRIITAPTRAVTARMGAPLVRGSVTATPPAGAVLAYLRVPRALQLTLPAITWTPDMAAWGVGGGVEKVVARGLSEVVQLAVRENRHLRRSSLSFVLEEVGNA